MKYREFLDLTDDEIKYILTEIFHPVSIGEIVEISHGMKL